MCIYIIYTHIYTYIYICTCTHIHTYYIYIYILYNVYMNIYIYINTHNLWTLLLQLEKPAAKTDAKSTKGVPKWIRRCVGCGCVCGCVCVVNPNCEIHITAL